MKYDWLLFDLDNTILDFDKAMIFALKKTIADHEILENEDHLSIYQKINKRCWEDFENGVITQDELRILRMRRFLEFINVDKSPIVFAQDYHLNLSSEIFYLENSKMLLGRWSKQFALVLVTNGLKDIQRARVAKDDLEKHFHHIVISDEIGVAKPHTGFFDYVFEKINFPRKEKVMIIGDSLSSDIRGGNNYGIHTCWLNQNGRVAPEDNLPTFEIGRLEELTRIIDY